jgi:hypothetical protein
MVLSVQHNQIRTLIALVAFFVVFACAHTASAASVVFSPSTGSYGAGQTFTVTVQADPQTKSINAVEAKLTFDKSKLSVVSVSKTGSAFSLWTTEPAFSNTAGTIDFGGGSPTPFSSRSNLMSITFRALAEGSAAVSVSSASILAADGLGTDVYTGATVMPAQLFTWAGMPEGMYIEKTAAGILVLLTILISLNAIAIILRKKFEVKW